VVTGPELVPALLELLQASLADEPLNEENT
jgi:hypothetical protein